ncbi:hypothetical protein [Thermodesulfovibrio yellowstonii]
MTRKTLRPLKMIEGVDPSLTLGVTVKSLGWQKKITNKCDFHLFIE